MRDSEREEVIGSITDLVNLINLPECPEWVRKKMTTTYRRLSWALDIDTNYREMPAIAWEIEHQE